MIPVIGVMIGFYILTRMVSFLSRGGERKETTFVHVLAAITILVAALGILSLGATAMSGLSGLGGLDG